MHAAAAQQPLTADTPHHADAAKGWLGLIIGTRLWYPFFDADCDDDTAFEERIDPVVSELGERGKRRTAMMEAMPPLSEGVPPPLSAAPVVAPAARAPKQARAVPASSPALPLHNTTSSSSSSASVVALHTTPRGSMAGYSPSLSMQPLHVPSHQQQEGGGGAMMSMTTDSPGGVTAALVERLLEQQRCVRTGLRAVS